MEDLIWFMETVDMGVDIGNFPGALYQGSLEARRHRPEHERRNETGNTEQEKEEGRDVREGCCRTPRS